MSLQAGTRIGSYEITAQIGAGGMGEVYQATDTRLARQVAIKVLPASFAGDPERLARFEREAKTLAALNHPNIAQIYGLEESGGVKALVMELVEGPTLADVIAGRSEDRPLRTEGEDRSEDRRGRPSGRPGAGLPVDEALAIARQVAEALEAAHEQGIIHRDLKPANIKLRPDGTVKVLDFGLAKAMEPAGASLAPGLSQSPTITTPAMTQAGMILGTAAYMSPEQARGRPVDKRADIWAFGCVLFEMLTGRKAFDEEDVGSALGAVIHKDPDWTCLPKSLSPTLAVYLRRCLHKDPRQRVGDAQDVRLALEGAFEVGPAPADKEPDTRSRWRLAVPWAAASLLGVLLAVVAFGGDPGSVAVPEPGLRRFSLLPAAGSEGAIAASVGGELRLSPDGSTLVYVGTRDEVVMLWVRRLDEDAARALPGTEGAGSPFWSPDSRSIGFFAQGRLMRTDPAGSPPQTILDGIGTGGNGGAWSEDDVILFSPTNTGGLYRVSANGGDVTPVTTLDATLGETGHTFPEFLPDGDHFVYAARGREGGVNLASLTTGTSRRLLAADSRAEYARVEEPASSYLLFVRGRTLLAQPFDDAALAPTGQPVAVGNDVNPFTATGWAPFTVSTAGVLAYLGIDTASELIWVTREGRPLGTVSAPAGRYVHVELSPDGTTIAASQTEPESDGYSTWLLDANGGAPARVSSGEDRLSDVRWSPDGRRLAFLESAPGRYAIVVTTTDRSGTADTWFESADLAIPSDFSPDGLWLALRRVPVGAQGGLWVLSTSGSHDLEAVRGTEARGMNARFSPDGRWVAYASSESGRNEVYVQRFPAAGAKYQVSTTGGARPRWSPDGRELYFVRANQLNGTGPLMVADVETGDTVRSSEPRRLFDVTFTSDSFNHYTYDVGSDGERFLVISPVENAASVPVTILLNWQVLADQ